MARQQRGILLRITTLVLFLLIPAFGIWTFVTAGDGLMEFPESISAYVGGVDGLFFLILIQVTVAIVGTELLLLWFLVRGGKSDSSESAQSRRTLIAELVWTAIPALLLIGVAIHQRDVWAKGAPSGQADAAEVGTIEGEAD